MNPNEAKCHLYSLFMAKALGLLDNKNSYFLP